MPALTYSNSDFVAFTKIKSAEVNAKFNDIQTLLNTTRLDDDNIQDDGITRATKLKAGTSNAVVVNDSSGDLTDLTLVNGGLLSQLSGALTAVPAGTQGQLLQSNAANLPSWVDSPFALPSHYIVSGAENSDGAVDIIRPDGAGTDDFTVRASTTNLVVVIENTQYTLTQDISVTGLDPLSTVTTNITATVNDARWTDQEFTKWVGDDSVNIVLDGVGSEIVSKAGELAAFRLNTGAGTEYFVARVGEGAAAGNAELEDVKRGYTIDDTGSPSAPIVFADNDTVTLLNLYWVFVSSTGTGHTTTLEPIYSDIEPATPATGQYWFDYGAGQWKVYDGASFVAQARILVGQVIVDENDAVVGARSLEKFAQYDAINTVKLRSYSDTRVKTELSGTINIAGTRCTYKTASLVFDITNSSQLVGSESSSTTYWCYITRDCELRIENTRPYSRPDLGGHYHPHKPWRAVGYFFNDASSNISWVRNIEHDELVSEIKFLSVSLSTTNTDYTELSFTNLEPLKWYTAHYQIRMEDGSANLDGADFILYSESGATGTPYARISARSQSNVESNTVTWHASITFLALSKNLYLFRRATGEDVIGTGDTTDTWCRITQHSTDTRLEPSLT